MAIYFYRIEVHFNNRFTKILGLIEKEKKSFLFLFENQSVTTFIFNLGNIFFQTRVEYFFRHNI